MDEGRVAAEMWMDASTVRQDCVCQTYGDYLILEILKKRGGVALAARTRKFSMPTANWTKIEGSSPPRRARRV